jgi:hypothetical protein
MKLSEVEKGGSEYIFVDKSVFFPKLGILAIGDLHLGYELMLRQSGVNLPETQVQEIIDDLKKIISQIKERGSQIKKIIFLGDIKHYFGFDFKERRVFDEILEFLKNYFEDKDIILIKGNHDKMDYSGKKMKNYFIKDGICFIHGHMAFPEIYDEKVKTIVMGHLHPSVVISDKANVKREKFKCFLVGKFHNKKIIILPSFFEIIEGTSVNDYREEYQSYFSIIPKDSVLNSEVFVIGKDEVYDFGKVKNLD